MPYRKSCVAFRSTSGELLAEINSLPIQGLYVRFQGSTFRLPHIQSSIEENRYCLHRRSNLKFADDVGSGLDYKDGFIGVKIDDGTEVFIIDRRYARAMRRAIGCWLTGAQCRWRAAC